MSQLVSELFYELFLMHGWLCEYGFDLTGRERIVYDGNGKCVKGNVSTFYVGSGYEYSAQHPAYHAWW